MREKIKRGNGKKRETTSSDLAALGNLPLKGKAFGKRTGRGRQEEPEGFMAQEFTETGVEPRRRMREGYRIYDAAEKMWLECRLWYEGLGWVDFWTHKGAQAQRFAGAKSARRMARDLQADRIGELLVVNRKGVVM